jgi:aspartyl-tRNA(Asn)/glutamyl-tRNA(Gln) amidotransferase subunit C
VDAGFDTSKPSTLTSGLRQLSNLKYIMPNTITLDDVRHVAYLARLALDDGQILQAQSGLNAVLASFSALAAIDVSGVEPLFHPAEIALQLRTDAITEHDQHAAFQAIAPDVAGQFYLVPQVLGT